MNALTTPAPLAVKPTNAPAVERMPTIMDLDTLLDMGRMFDRLGSGERTTVRRFGRGRKILGHPRLADRDMQDERCRSASLARRGPRQNRQPPFHQQNRRSCYLGPTSKTRRNAKRRENSAYGTTLRWRLWLRHRRRPTAACWRRSMRSRTFEPKPAAARWIEVSLGRGATIGGHRTR
jgi:hypothetical protein